MLNRQQRITGTCSYISAHEPRKMPASRAASLYARLKPFLTLVEPYGMGLPSLNENRRGSLDDYPLAFRGRPNSCEYPVIPKWNAHTANGKLLSFKGFLRAYNIEPIADEGNNMILDSARIRGNPNLILLQRAEEQAR